MYQVEAACCTRVRLHLPYHTHPFSVWNREHFDTWDNLFLGAFALGDFLTGELMVRWLLSRGFLSEAFDIVPLEHVQYPDERKTYWREKKQGKTDATSERQEQHHNNRVHRRAPARHTQLMCVSENWNFIISLMSENIVSYWMTLCIFFFATNDFSQ